MDAGTVLAGGTLAGFLYSAWDYVKRAAWRVASLLLVRVEYDKYDLDQLLRWATLNGTPSRLRDRAYGFNGFFHRGQDCHWLAVERMSMRSVLVWVGWKPLWFSFPPEPPPASSPPNQTGQAGLPARSPEAARVIFFRGTFDPDGLAVNAAATRNAERGPEASKFGVTISVYDADGEYTAAAACGVGRDRLVGGAPPADEDPTFGLCLSPQTLGLLAEAKQWAEDGPWFKGKGIPHKSGWFLTGPPGSGKSALAVVLAKTLNCKLIQVNLAGMTNSRFQTVWSHYVLPELPAVVLFEDFDNVFHGRTNVTAQVPYHGYNTEGGDPRPGERIRREDLTFDVLLNAIDGVRRAEGLFLVITANDASKVDPALAAPETDDLMGSSRPGRIDRTLYMGDLPKEQCLELADHVCGGCEGALAVARRLILAGEIKGTAARVRNALQRLALAERAGRPLPVPAGPPENPNAPAGLGPAREAYYGAYPGEAFATAPMPESAHGPVDWEIDDEPQPLNSWAPTDAGLGQGFAGGPPVTHQAGHGLSPVYETPGERMSRIIRGQVERANGDGK